MKKLVADVSDPIVVAANGDPTPTLDVTLESIPSYRTGQALLAKFEKTGDEAAFEQLVRMYAGMVYTVCNGVTKNNHDAEDSTQATFLALATQVKLGKPVKYLGPWLRQVAKRTALDLRKSRKRRQKREENHHIVTGADTFDEHAGEANLTAEEHKKALHDEINKLPARYRLPLVMHYFGGLKPEETALELNCKPKTLAVRLHRGRKMLAEKLSRRGLFAGSEMLGVSCVPALFASHELMSGSVLHQTSHAAANLLTGHDISTLISSRVMALVRGSAKAAIFAKIKFAAAMLIVSVSMLTGSAKAIEKLGASLPFHFDLPNFRLNVTDWLRPMLRNVVPAPRVMADASSTSKTSVKPAIANVTFASAMNRTPSSTGHVIFTAPQQAALASFEQIDTATPVQLTGDRNFIASNVQTFVDPVGPVDLTESEDHSLANDPNAFALLASHRGSVGGGRSSQLELIPNVSLLGPTTRRIETNVTPTPEPSSALLLAGSALAFSRVTRARRRR